MVDRALPGLEPEAMCIRVQRRPDGSVDVSTWSGADLRFLRLDEATLYSDLTANEACDVLYAVLDSLGLV